MPPKKAAGRSKPLELNPNAQISKIAGSSAASRQAAKAVGTLRLKTLGRANVSDFSAMFNKHKEVAEQHLVLADEAKLGVLNLLDHPHARIKALSEDAIANLSQDEGEIVMSPSGFKSLSQMLSYNDMIVQREALWTLSSMAAVSEKNHAALTDATPWPVIISRANSTNVDVKEAAITLLANLSSNEEYHDIIISEGILDIMKEVARENDVKLQRAACKGFANLTSCGENIDEVLEDGGLELIIGFTKSDDEELVAAALHTLANICSQKPEIRKRFLRDNLIPDIIKLMQHPNEMIRSGAIALVRQLMEDKECHQKLFDLGALDALIRIGNNADNEPPEVTRVVAAAFNVLASNPQNKTILNSKAKRALDCLARSEDAETLREVNAALAKLGHSKDAQREEQQRLAREKAEREAAALDAARAERELEERARAAERAAKERQLAEQRRLAAEEAERKERERAEKEKLTRNMAKLDIKPTRAEDPVEAKWKRDLFQELNYVRSQPQAYAKDLEKLRDKYDGLDFYITKTRVLETEEGVSALNGAVSQLSTMKPLPPFERQSEGMCRSCLDLCVETISTASGRARGGDCSERWDRYGKWDGKMSEIIAYRNDDPAQAVREWIIDDGNLDRYNRSCILSSSFKVVGFAHHDHPQKKCMVVVQFATNFEEDLDAQRQATTPRGAAVDNNADANDPYISIVQEVETADPTTLKLVARGRSLNLTTTEGKQNKVLDNSYRFQLPVSFDPVEVTAVFSKSDRKVRIKVPKLASANAKFYSIHDEKIIPIR